MDGFRRMGTGHDNGRMLLSVCDGLAVGWCFGVVTGGSFVGIPFGGSPFGHPPYDGYGGLCRIIGGFGWRGARISLR